MGVHVRYFSRAVRVLAAGLMVSIFADLSMGTEALACSVQPRSVGLSHDRAIAHAKWIVLAKFKGIEKRPTQKNRRLKEARFARFEVVEYLKGEGTGEVFIQTNEYTSSRNHDRKEAEANYYGHSVSSFWAFGSDGEVRGDCRMHPSFQKRGTLYVVFGGEENPVGRHDEYGVGFENVIEGDLWTQYVREVVATEQGEKPFPRLLPDYFGDAKAVVRLRAEWTEGGPSLSTEILAGPELPYFHLLFADPYGSVASFLDPKCRARYYRPHGVRRNEAVDWLVVIERMPTKKMRWEGPTNCQGGDRRGYSRITGDGLFSVTGNRFFSIYGDKVDFGEETPIKGEQGRPVQVLALSEVKRLAGGQVAEAGSE